MNCDIAQHLSESFYLQEVITNTETHNCPQCTEFEIAECSALKDMYISPTYTSPKAQGSFQGWGQKECKNQRWQMTTIKHPLDTAGQVQQELTVVATVCTKDQVPVWRGELGIQSHPPDGSTWQLLAAGK